MYFLVILYSSDQTFSFSGEVSTEDPRRVAKGVFAPTVLFKPLQLSRIYRILTYLMIDVLDLSWCNTVHVFVPMLSLTSPGFENFHPGPWWAQAEWFCWLPKSLEQTTDTDYADWFSSEKRPGITKLAGLEVGGWLFNALSTEAAVTEILKEPYYDSSQALWLVAGWAGGFATSKVDCIILFVDSRGWSRQSS